MKALEYLQAFTLAAVILSFARYFWLCKQGAEK